MLAKQSGRHGKSDVYKDYWGTKKGNRKRLVVAVTMEDS